MNFVNDVGNQNARQLPGDVVIPNNPVGINAMNSTQRALLQAYASQSPGRRIMDTLTQANLPSAMSKPLASSTPDDIGVPAWYGQSYGGLVNSGLPQGAFKKGGTVPKTANYQLHKGEVVIPKNRVGGLKDKIKDIAKRMPSKYSPHQQKDMKSASGAIASAMRMNPDKFRGGV